MWISFQYRSIHKCSWIPFISITHDIFLFSFYIRSNLPFNTSKKSSSTSSSQSRGEYLFYNISVTHSLQNFFYSLVSIIFQEVIYILRVNNSTIFKCSSFLFLIKFHIFRIMNTFFSFRIYIK